MRLPLFVLLGMISCKQEAAQPEVVKAPVTLARAVAPRASAQEALALAKPKRVSISSFDEMGGGATIVGSAESSADVAEFIVALKDIVRTPKGLGRVVDRARNGNLRVEHFGGLQEILEIHPSEVSFFFADLESKSAEGPSKSVNFEITLSVLQ